jgi:hypothetical protein
MDRGTGLKFSGLGEGEIDIGGAGDRVLEILQGRCISEGGGSNAHSSSALPNLRIQFPHTGRISSHCSC